MSAQRDRAAFDDAARISSQLEAVRRIMRQAISAEAQRYPVPLTPPQVQALQVLVDAQRETGGGLSLSELSGRMGLAHSTVSGIVSRLEGRGVLQRTTPTDDRRFTRIELTQPVKEWLQHDLPAARLRPLADALAGATDEERAAIVNGVATLHRLLERPATPAGSAAPRST